MAEFELKRDFYELHETPGATPSDFGLKVVTDPSSTMLVTAINKARNVKKTMTSFSSRAVATVYIPKDDQIRRENIKIIDSFLSCLPNSNQRCGDSVRSQESDTKYWIDIPSDLVLNQLLKNKFRIDQNTSSFSLKTLVIPPIHKYIKENADINKKSIEMYCRQPATWQTFKTLHFLFQEVIHHYIYKWPERFH